MLEYPVVLEPAEEGGYVVRFPDVPEAITQGEDAEEALMRAIDALETALEFYVEHRRPLPVPSKAKAGPVVRPRALTCAKLGVYRTMLERHVGKAELARRLHWHLPQIDRLLDLGHASRIDQIEAAYTALGKEFLVSIAEAAPRRAPSRDLGRPRDGGIRHCRLIGSRPPAVDQTAVGRKGALAILLGPGVLRVFRTWRSGRACGRGPERLHSAYTARAHRDENHAML